MLNQNPPLRNLELQISYLGTAYKGWQVQPDVATVQGRLHQALDNILKDKYLKTMGASRTDAGVHAHDQHVSFQTSSTVPLASLKYAINCQLPDDIYVNQINEHANAFSARYNAMGKHYAYYLYNHRYAPLHVAAQVWAAGYRIDVDKMAEAANAFLGTRCFKALQASADFREETETTIYDVRFVRKGRLVSFEVLGRHFLYHMIRNMFGSLMMVGRGEWSVSSFVDRLNSGDRTMMGQTAPAQGLHLIKVFYDTEPDHYSETADNLRDFLSLGETIVPGSAP